MKYDCSAMFFHRSIHTSIRQQQSHNSQMAKKVSCEFLSDNKSMNSVIVFDIFVNAMFHSILTKPLTTERLLEKILVISSNLRGAITPILTDFVGCNLG